MGFTLRPGELPPEVHEAVRSKGAVVWDDEVGGWLVSGYEEVRAVLRDTKRFTSRYSVFKDVFGAEAMLVNDTELHHRLRAIWSQALSVKGIRAVEPSISEIAEALLADPLAALSHGQTVDLVPVFKRYTSDVIATLMDLPRDRYDDYQRWNAAMSGTGALSLPDDHPAFLERERCKCELHAFLDELIESRRQRVAADVDPGDMVSMIVAAEGQEGITRSVVRDNLLNLLIGALDTTSRWMGSIVFRLTEEPQLQAAARADKTLLLPLMEEVLRLETVVQVGHRHVRNEPVDLGGVRLASGDKVLLLHGAANRDPAVFKQPASLEPGRQGKLHMGFGFGIHQCAGLNLARGEVAIFLRLFLERTGEFNLVRREYSSNWSLWGPTVLELRTRG